MLEDYSFSPQSAGDGSPSDVFHDHGGPSQCIQPDYFGRFFKSSECSFLSQSLEEFIWETEKIVTEQKKGFCVRLPLLEKLIN